MTLKYSNRENILSHARRRFFLHGYTGTSVQRILEDSGLSRGAFYHHFASKQALLEAVLEGLVEDALADLEKRLKESPRRTAAEELELFLGHSLLWRQARPTVMRRLLNSLYRDENLVLLQRLRLRQSEAARPVLARILARGAAEGEFSLADPEGAAELILGLIAAARDLQARDLLRGDVSTDRLQGRLENTLRFIERAVGLEYRRLTTPQISGLIELIQNETPPGAAP